MKRSFLYFVMFQLVLAFTACHKKSPENPSGSVENPVPQSPGSPSCTATLAAAENVQIFPADNPWNTVVANRAVDQNSTAIINKLLAYGLKADFGSGLYEGRTIGIPFIAVCSQDAMANVVFRANEKDGNYGNESDQQPYNIPLSAPIEGEGYGDAHVIAIDIQQKKLYELYNASLRNGKWEASSGAIFDLSSNEYRPAGWTSADAAGLPIFPGLVRYEEILKGEIDHPIRFTLARSNIQPAYVAPARHLVNTTGSAADTLPFGARIRLKESFDISKFSATNQVILKAMKKYGLILADIGSNFYISGAPDSRWNNDDLAKLGAVKGANFEVVNFH
ncbi:MAG: hypothetical protein REI78_11320 [Pedobacter sp.]|nr:hypothetical protein [Pedobacter sp.]